MGKKQKPVQKHSRADRKAARRRGGPDKLSASEEAAFRQQLKAQGLRVKPIASDGNCMVRPFDCACTARTYNPALIYVSAHLHGCTMCVRAV